MKLKLLALFLAILLIAVTAKPSYATNGPCAAGMIDNIDYLLTLDDGTETNAQVTSTGSSPAVYKDSTNFFLDADGTKKIMDVKTVTITHNQNFLNQVALNGGVLEKNITYFSPGTCENENKSLKTIKDKSGIWDFDYNAGNDAACVFAQPITLELRDPKAVGDNLVCSQSYAFNTQAADIPNNCQISMTPASGATISDSITITANDINDEGVSIRLYLNNQDISPTALKTNDPIGTFPVGVLSGTNFTLVKNANNLLDLTFPLGAKSVGDYIFEVKYEDGPKAGQNICVLQFPVVEYGATPTPAQQLDATYSASLLVDVQETVPLCKSIPATADCGGESCQVKCVACENAEKIWTGIGCIPTNFGGLVSALFTTFSGLLGGLVFICIVVNGLRIMTSRGNPEAMKKSQEAITACIVGFVVLVLSVLFLKIVGVDILKLPGWS